MIRANRIGDMGETIAHQQFGDSVLDPPHQARPFEHQGGVDLHQRGAGADLGIGIRGARDSADAEADAAAGWRLAVCSNKLEGLSRGLLEKLGLIDRLAAICGGDSFAVRKPDPLHLTETIRRAGGAPENAVMVGDSASDIDAAKAASIPVVAVDFGYTPIPVTELGPDRVISHFDELWDAVAELRSSHRDAVHAPGVI